MLRGSMPTKAVTTATISLSEQACAAREVYRRRLSPKPDSRLEDYLHVGYDAARRQAIGNLSFSDAGKSLLVQHRE